MLPPWPSDKYPRTTTHKDNNLKYLLVVIQLHPGAVTFNFNNYHQWKTSYQEGFEPATSSVVCACDCTTIQICFMI